MKLTLITALVVVCSCTSMGDKTKENTQHSSQQLVVFTNKTEANNLTLNGHKEGKWLEYLDRDEVPIGDTAYAVFYKLTVYKDGYPTGIVREYFKNGKLANECTYFNGQRNGIEKVYYKNGNLMWLAQETNGKTEGLVKGYYESGKLKSEANWANNLPNGIYKEYYENGKLKSETTYTAGKAEETKNYDENGEEIQ